MFSTVASWLKCSCWLPGRTCLLLLDTVTSEFDISCEDEDSGCRAQWEICACHACRQTTLSVFFQLFSQPQMWTDSTTIYSTSQSLMAHKWTPCREDVGPDCSPQFEMTNHRWRAHSHRTDAKTFSSMALLSLNWIQLQYKRWISTLEVFMKDVRSVKQLLEPKPTHFSLVLVY